MKRILPTTAGLAALWMAPAIATDLAPPPIYTKAPPAIPVAPLSGWAGFYLGLNAGGASGHDCWDLIGDAHGPRDRQAEGCHNGTGAVAGGQIGYRWQAANVVFGVEAQGDWSHLSGSNVTSVVSTISDCPPPDTTKVNSTKIDSIGLFTGQVGYTWNNALVYVKGGAAFTHDKYRGTTDGALTDQASETRWGSAVGTGVEYGIAPNWSVGIEYDHLFMGNRDVTLVSNAGVSRIDTIRQDIDMGTVRLNYRFGGPMLAKF
jgi:outer membrane immunogenic protein